MFVYGHVTPQFLKTKEIDISDMIERVLPVDSMLNSTDALL